MASVFKAKGEKRYTITYVDHTGKRRKQRGSTDKAVSLRIAKELENRAILRREQVIDPRQEAFQLHESSPLTGHIADWGRALRARARSEKYVQLQVDRVRLLAALVHGMPLRTAETPRSAARGVRHRREAALDSAVAATRLVELTTSGLQGALARLREADRSLQTLNHYRAAVRAFCRWCVKEGRLRHDPTQALTGFNVQLDRRHDRRTLSVDELKRLMAAAQLGAPYRKMTGPARALCYQLAVASGLRYSELKSITTSSFQFGPAPTVTVTAGYTKNGQSATQALPPDLAAELRPFVEALAPQQPVFPLPDKAAAMLRVDLEAAGIPYCDDSGNVFDFHALRCQCATLADAAGISPRVVQRIMRHSTLDLTNRYTRPRAVDLEQAVVALPSLRPDAGHLENASEAAKSAASRPAPGGATGGATGTEKTRRK